MTGYDPMAVANLILDEADRNGIEITNLALQKILYFAHGQYLVETGKPLIDGFFEAWQHGPMNVIVYKAFKDSDKLPIKTRAKKVNLLTGETYEVDKITDVNITKFVNRILLLWGNMPVWRLVELSHAKNGPWNYVVEKSREHIVFGLRISDKVIVNRFKYHKISVKSEPKAEIEKEITHLPKFAKSEFG